MPTESPVITSLGTEALPEASFHERDFGGVAREIGAAEASPATTTNHKKLAPKWYVFSDFLLLYIYSSF